MMKKNADLANILENCLNQVEAGRPIEEVVNEYASLSRIKGEDLRAILQVAQDAIPTNGSLRVPASAQRDSRQRFLAQAQKLNQLPGAASYFRWRRFLHFFRVNSGSLAFATGAILLLFLALGSVRSLPGDGLYPVKLAAEQAGISLSSSTAERDVLQSGFDNRRAVEVATMIQMRRTGEVSFGGFLSSTKENPLSGEHANGWQIDEISLQLSDPQRSQASGLVNAYVEITGYLGIDGQVQVKTLEPRLVSLQGKIINFTTAGWIVNSQPVRVSAYTQVDGNPEIGSRVTIQAAHLINTTDLLAITAHTDLENPPQTASPIWQMTETETVLPTETPEPSETVSPTAVMENPINAKPNATAAPSNHSDGQKPGDNHSGTEQETPDPTHQSDN